MDRRPRARAKGALPGANGIAGWRTPIVIARIGELVPDPYRTAMICRAFVPEPPKGSGSIFDRTLDDVIVDEDAAAIMLDADSHPGIRREAADRVVRFRFKINDELFAHYLEVQAGQARRGYHPYNLDQHYERNLAAEAVPIFLAYLENWRAIYAEDSESCPWLFPSADGTQPIPERQIRAWYCHAQGGTTIKKSSVRWQENQ